MLFYVSAMKTKKYLVFGGQIQTPDGKRYYLSAINVAELYGIDIRECYLVNDWRDGASAFKRRGLIVLYPDDSGKYNLNTAA